LRSSVTIRAALPPPTIVRETRAGAADAITAEFVSDSRGGAFITFQFCPAPATACCETAPPATGKTPLAKLIGCFPLASSGCTGTTPSNPFFDRMNTPVTGRNGTNPLNPPNPSPGDHSHPNPGSNTHPP
jgi:hypothetical protein